MQVSGNWQGRAVGSVLQAAGGLEGKAQCAGGSESANVIGDE